MPTLPAAAVRVRPSTDKRPRIRLAGLRDRAAWDAYVRGHAQGTIFHTTAWSGAVEDAFGHRFLGLMLERDGQIAGVLPLMLVESRLAGRMLVSMPYGVGGGILAEGPAETELLWAEARALAERAAARTIELRSAVAAIGDLPVLDRYVGFRKELPARAEDVLGWLPRKARAEARHARFRHGLTADFDGRQLELAWRLYARSMRRLGSLCYPYRFFVSLADRFAGDVLVQLVRRNDRLLSGLVSFRFRDEFLPYFSGCDERFNHLGTNNFLYLAAMERAVELGCRIFDFGRTRLDNRGAFDFKRFQGFSPTPLGYQRWVQGGGRAVDLSPTAPRWKIARRCWRHLPMPAVTLLSAWVSRHIPG